MRRDACLKAWSAWAPGTSSPDEWAEWAAGRRVIERSDAAPSLDHLPVLFKRRLSQVSRMVLHVGHQLSPGPREVKTVYASEYGEVGRQAALTASLAGSGEISPSAFSLSVFNTPVALLSMAEKNTERSVTLNAGPESFETALWESLALQERSGDPEVLMIAADEVIPAPFDELVATPNIPYALGLLLGDGTSGVRLELEMEFGRRQDDRDALHPSGLRFLRWFLGDRLEPLRLDHGHCTFSVK